MTKTKKMTPISFPESNVTFAKDQPEYLPLPAWRDEEGQVVSCWNLTWRERFKVLFWRKHLVKPTHVQSTIAATKALHRESFCNEVTLHGIPLDLSQDDYAFIGGHQSHCGNSAYPRCRMTLNNDQRQLVLGALDSLGVALTNHEHQWTDGERAIYEEALRVLGEKSVDAPSGQGGDDSSHATGVS